VLQLQRVVDARKLVRRLHGPRRHHRRLAVARRRRPNLALPEGRPGADALQHRRERREFSWRDLCDAQPVGGAGRLGRGAGGGAEWAFAKNWTLKAEYEYLGFDRTVQACGLASSAAGVLTPNAPYCTSTQMHGVHTAKVGINWKLSDRVWPF
jgi:hypothetical protein